jgi:hypothetical protein
MLPRCQPLPRLTSKFSDMSSSTYSASVNSAHCIPTISTLSNKLTMIAYDTRKTTRPSFFLGTTWILCESLSIFGRIWAKQLSSCQGVLQDARDRAGSKCNGRDSGNINSGWRMAVTLHHFVFGFIRILA